MTAKDALHEGPTDRQAQILGLVVREYVATAQPVSSGSLAGRFQLGVSPATVRHELAALEAMGLLTHPHTSAGRVPTVAGYRYFAEHLMSSAGLPESIRRTIRHQFHQAGWDPERWMRLSAAVMARTSGVAGMVATPRARPAPLRRLELVDLGDGLVHVVAIMADGFVQQARWHPEHAFDQADLDRISHAVNEAEGRSAGQAPAGGEGLGAWALAALEELVAGGNAGPPRMFHAGLVQVLEEPEFAEGSGLRGIVELLEHGQGLEPILDRLPATGVQVIIGGEPPLEWVPGITLVLSRFGDERVDAGVLGVVGPTRLPYERAVPTVGFVARLMTRLLAGQAI